MVTALRKCEIGQNITLNFSQFDVFSRIPAILGLSTKPNLACLCKTCKLTFKQYRHGRFINMTGQNGISHARAKFGACVYWAGSARRTVTQHSGRSVPPVRIQRKKHSESQTILTKHAQRHIQHLWQTFTFEQHCSSLVPRCKSSCRPMLHHAQKRALLQPLFIKPVRPISFDGRVYYQMNKHRDVSHRLFQTIQQACCPSQLF